jgi:hypothetical protein
MCRRKFRGSPFQRAFLRLGIGDVSGVGACSMIAEMSQWSLTQIKSTGASEPTLGEVTPPLPSWKIAPTGRGAWAGRLTLVPDLREIAPSRRGRVAVDGALGLVPRTSALFRAASAARLTARPDLSERAYLLTVPFQAAVKSLSVERPINVGTAQVGGRHDLSHLSLRVTGSHATKCPLWVKSGHQGCTEALSDGPRKQNNT